MRVKGKIQEKLLRVCYVVCMSVYDTVCECMCVRVFIYEHGVYVCMSVYKSVRVADLSLFKVPFKSVHPQGKEWWWGETQEKQ